MAGTEAPLLQKRHASAATQVAWLAVAKVLSNEGEG
jgi:hypothetical protein